MSILLAFLASVAHGGPTQAEIPFFSTISAPDWRVDGDRGLWIRGNTRQWYYASFMGQCPRARTALGLGFDTSPGDQFDRHSAIIAEGQRCPIVSLVESDAPPKSRKR